MKMNSIKSLLCTGGILLSTSLVTFGQNGKYKISGSIEGLPAGAKIEMVPTNTHKDEEPVATSPVTNGKFEFTGKVESPRAFYMRVVGAEFTGFPVMVENSIIKITGTAYASKEFNGRRFQIPDLEVTGSKSHELMLAKLETRKRLDDIYEGYYKDAKDVLEELKQARTARDGAREKELMASPAYMQFEKAETEFFQTAKDSIEHMVLSNRDSWWGPYLLMNQYSYLRADERRLYEQFSKEAKDSYYGKLAAAEMYPKSFLGQAAPALVFEDEANKKVDFASLAKGKRYVILDFWASWCNPCRKAIPGMKEFYTAMKDQGVEIISISIDKRPADWTKANKEENLPWPSFLDKGAMSKAYGIKAIPSMYLLDGNGIVLVEDADLAKIREKMK
jgi:thiol-disulfide isomerase/thioredoxin